MVARILLVISGCVVSIEGVTASCQFRLLASSVDTQSHKTWVIVSSYSTSARAKVAEVNANLVTIVAELHEVSTPELRKTASHTSRPLPLDIEARSSAGLVD